MPAPANVIMFLHRSLFMYFTTLSKSGFSRTFSTSAFDLLLRSRWRRNKLASHSAANHQTLSVTISISISYYQAADGNYIFGGDILCHANETTGTCNELVWFITTSDYFLMTPWKAHFGPKLLCLKWVEFTYAPIKSFYNILVVVMIANHSIYTDKNKHYWKIWDSIHF